MANSQKTVNTQRRVSRPVPKPDPQCIGRQVSGFTKEEFKLFLKEWRSGLDLRIKKAAEEKNYQESSELCVFGWKIDRLIREYGKGEVDEETQR